MHTLVVFAHPEPDSLTGSTAHSIATGVTGTPGHTSEVADLTAEGFDPTFTTADLAVIRGTGRPPEDVRREQSRIERADRLVLVFPVYWWTMPALLKGWVDRVFTDGWAYGDGGDALVNREVHLVALAGASAGVYDRHGYTESMRVAIDHGVFEYCNSRVTSSHVLHDVDQVGTATLTAKIDALVGVLNSYPGKRPGHPGRVTGPAVTESHDQVSSVTE
ncbi:NAD(P)H-dependent oxidoreductase [Actinoplanes rectilineatus]|uniref:NAD(P)H-dependent oxidoreductase n=1 Tax=Actinoplanes rectilineatus TaxID=113571 RepID=UPI0009FB6C53|nr:NAD(P)H-dependent oxidoreductase [Actinoplanes rectilineatus]